MAYENAKRILKNDEMRIERNDQSIYDDGVVIGFWEGIESRHLEECIEWLNHPDNDEVGSTETFFDIAFGVKLYHLHARFSEKEGRLYRILSKELNVAAPITEADTRWRIKSGSNYRGSNDVQILELPYCDPLVVEEIIRQNTDQTYTNSIWTINGGLLSGTWHNIKTIFEIDEQTGRAKALWFLSKQANDDLHFAYYRNPNTFVVDFFKFDASETGLASLETDYFFDKLGNWYIGDGANYTSKNGVEETAPYPALPADVPSLGNLRTAIPGRMAHPVEISRSETTRFYRAHVHMEFFDEVLIGNSVSYGTPLVTVTESIVEGATSLPNLTGIAKYNDEGTKETNTNIVSPQRDPIKGTWSYILQVIEKWAPHANQDESDDDYGLPGFVEGPSEIRIKSEPLSLARGIGSGYSALGSWGGGGKGRIRYNSDTPTLTAKNFRPYNISLARCCTMRTTTRLYYYVKEPSINQYPSPTTNQYPDAYSGTIEDKDYSDVGSITLPVVQSVVVDDSSHTFGTDRVFVKHTYTNGVFTIVCYDNDGSIWFIRTYPSEDNGPVLIDEAGLQIDPTGTLTNDDGLYMGHYVVEDVDEQGVPNFYTEAIRHRILKVSESIYALVIETAERTAWKMDDINKWIFNAEEIDIGPARPPSTPSLADISGEANVPFIM